MLEKRPLTLPAQQYLLFGIYLKGANITNQNDGLIFRQVAALTPELGGDRDSFYQIAGRVSGLLCYRDQGDRI